MKFYFTVIVSLLIACSIQNESKKENNQDVLSQDKFEIILKEIHMAEASFQLTKHQQEINAKKELTNTYLKIYKKHQISAEYFQKSLKYYSINSEKIEESYNNVLNKLQNEKSILESQ